MESWMTAVLVFHVIVALAVIGLVLLHHLSLPANLFKTAFPNLQMPFWIGVELFFHA